LIFSLARREHRQVKCKSLIATAPATLTLSRRRWQERELGDVDQLLFIFVVNTTSMRN